MLAIVMLADAALPSNETLARAIHARLADARIPSETTDERTGAILFFERGVMGGIRRVDRPWPLSREHPRFPTAWYWPEAWETVKDHKAHIVVSATGGADARSRVPPLGQLVAAPVECTPAALAALAVATSPPGRRRRPASRFGPRAGMPDRVPLVLSDSDPLFPTPYARAVKSGITGAELVGVADAGPMATAEPPAAALAAIRRIA